MPAIFVNYNYTPEWLSEWPSISPIVIYDRSDDGIERNLERFGHVRKTENIGNVDFDKLSFLIEFYDSLPKTFLWAKSNLLKYVAEPDLRKALEAGEFAPLLKFNHKTYSDRYGVVCYYAGNMYFERNDSWYFAEMDNRFLTYDAWARHLNLSSPKYLPFGPGGNLVLTKERVHRYGVDFYQKMADTLSYGRLPAEAHAAERTYQSLWQ